MKPTEENRLLLREGRKIVEALGKTLAPLVEVVLHDLTDPDHAVVADPDGHRVELTNAHR
jgi:predicted transcriptional regulator YheO